MNFFVYFFDDYSFLEDCSWWVVGEIDVDL